MLSRVLSVSVLSLGLRWLLIFPALAHGQTSVVPRDLREYLELTPDQAAEIERSDAALNVRLGEWNAAYNRLDAAIRAARTEDPPNPGKLGAAHAEQVRIARDAQAAAAARRAVILRSLSPEQTRRLGIIAESQRESPRTLIREARGSQLIEQDSTYLGATPGAIALSHLVARCDDGRDPFAALRPFLGLSAAQSAAVCATLRPHADWVDRRARRASEIFAGVESELAEPAPSAQKIGVVFSEAAAIDREVTRAAEEVRQQVRSALTADQLSRVVRVAEWVRAVPLYASALCERLVDTGGSDLAPPPRISCRAESGNPDPIPAVTETLRTQLELSREQAEAIVANDQAWNRRAREGREQRAGLEQRAAAATNNPALLGQAYVEIELLRRRLSDDLAQRGRRNADVLTPDQRRLVAEMTTALDQSDLTDAARSVWLLRDNSSIGFPLLFVDGEPCLLARGSGAALAAFLQLSRSQIADLCVAAVEGYRRSLEAARATAALQSRFTRAAREDPVEPATLGRLSAEIGLAARDQERLLDTTIARTHGYLTFAQLPAVLQLERSANLLTPAYAARCEGLMPARQSVIPSRLSYFGESEEYRPVSCAFVRAFFPGQVLPASRISPVAFVP